LIQLKPSVIVVGNSAAAIAAKQATATIPIVATALFDPVSIGLVASHARPEGNVTGLVAGWDTVIGKQLDLSFEVVPGAKLIGNGARMPHAPPAGSGSPGRCSRRPPDHRSHVPANSWFALVAT
jgi:putative ABC transport system substrate-binding protein